MRSRVPRGARIAKMKEKAVEFARECRVFEGCNPHQAQKVLEANLETSRALPCRIGVYQGV